MIDKQTRQPFQEAEHQKRCRNAAGITTMHLARLAVPPEEVLIFCNLPPYGFIEAKVKSAGQVGLRVYDDEGPRSRFNFLYSEDGHINFATATNGKPSTMQVETAEDTYLPTAHEELVTLNGILHHLVDAVVDTRQ